MVSRMMKAWYSPTPPQVIMQGQKPSEKQKKHSEKRIWNLTTQDPLCISSCCWEPLLMVDLLLYFFFGKHQNCADKSRFFAGLFFIIRLYFDLSSLCRQNCFANLWDLWGFGFQLHGCDPQATCRGSHIPNKKRNRRPSKSVRWGEFLRCFWWAAELLVANTWRAWHWWVLQPCFWAFSVGQAWHWCQVLAVALVESWLSQTWIASRLDEQSDMCYLRKLWSRCCRLSFGFAASITMTTMTTSIIVCRHFIAHYLYPILISGCSIHNMKIESVTRKLRTNQRWYVHAWGLAGMGVHASSV